MTETPTEGLLRRDDCALVIVDVQEGFYGDRNDVDREQLSAVVERVGWLAGLATALEIPVVVTEEYPHGNGPTAARVRDRLAASAVTMAKETFSAPDNADIRKALEATGAGSMVFVGMETDVCIAHSAIRSRELGWRVAAVTDATYSPGPAHAEGIMRMSAKGIDLMSTKQVFYDWVRSLHEIKQLREVAPELRATPGFVL